MIYIKEPKVVVENGKDSYGSIAVKTGKIEVAESGATYGALILRDILGNQFVGTGYRVDEVDIATVPSVEIRFYNKKSIDTYIKALEQIKAAMDDPESYRAFAC